MAIKLIDDVVAPLVVAVADIATTEKKPTWNRPVGIGLSLAGYILGGVMGMGGSFTKNLGIAAAPWMMESIYMYAKEKTFTPTSRIVDQSSLQMRVASRSRVSAGGGQRLVSSTRPVGLYVEEAEILS